MPHGPHRIANKEYREERDKQIWEQFHTEGLNKPTIGERWGISAWTVGTILRRMRAEKMVEFVRKDLGG